MKYHVIGITALIAVLLIVFFISSADRENPQNRIHQHLTSRGPEEVCTCDQTELCTHLPLVIIDTGGKEIPGKPITDENEQEIGFTTAEDGSTSLSASLSVMDDPSKNHHPSDRPDLESSMLIRIRGNSSRYFDKKSYLIRLTQKDGSYRDEEMIGMPAHYEWALHGPYLDRSLIRNYMWYNISGEIMEYSPNARFCEVILNGKYQGLYLMTETITNGKDCRINVSKPVQKANRTGYLLRLDRGSSLPAKNIRPFTNYAYRNSRRMDIKYPRAGDLTPELAASISQDFSDFEKSLYSYDYDTDDYGYFNNIDVQSFVDYFIINEFTANYDAGRLSTYPYRDIGGLYKIAVWDFNSACDNYIPPTVSPQHFEIHQAVWFDMLMRDEYFVHRILERYEELRKTYLSEEYLDQYIDETISYLGPAVDRNFEIWGYTFQSDMPSHGSVPITDYETAILQIKEFIHNRGIWMDENIHVLQQYCHESKNKKFNH